MSSIETLQRPHHDHGSPSESHDELRGEEIQDLPVGQQAPLDATDPTRPGPSLSLRDSPTHPSSSPPGWKRLISSPLTAHERTSLITTIFSNRDEIEAMRQIGEDDAQTFINIIYGVRLRPLLSPKSDPADFVHRRWIPSTTRRE